MKTVTYFLSVATIAVLFLATSTVSAQSKMQTKFIPFAIDINATDTTITLKCTAGCGWETLSFSTPTESEQWIDASGMTQKTSPSITDKKLAPFKFSFQKMGDTFYLKSTQGSAWKEIPLNANARFMMQINEFGMVQ